MSEVSLIYTTWPDAETARSAAQALLDEELIACANLLPAGTSLYRWKGEVYEEAEHIMWIKTARAEDCRAHIQTLHPYEEPAILVVPVDEDASSAGFLDWIMKQSGGL